jgi:hypothetical protein
MISKRNTFFKSNEQCQSMINDQNSINYAISKLNLFNVLLSFKVD